MNHHSLGWIQRLFGFIFLAFALIGLIAGIAYYNNQLGKLTEHLVRIGDTASDGCALANCTQETKLIIQASVVSTGTIIATNFMFIFPLFVLIEVVLFAVAVLLVTQGYSNKHLANDILDRASSSPVPEPQKHQAAKEKK